MRAAGYFKFGLRIEHEEHYRKNAKLGDMGSGRGHMT